jgi:antitoxin (DNA-binding transcriptional repressor) of toxin-antitoxin stability system
MRVVGVKQLKAKLSEYLRDVRRGEVFLVTDRDRVIAELRPAASDVLPPIDDVAEMLEQLQQAGDVAAARLSKEAWSWTDTGLGLAAGTSATVLDAVRADRDEDSG